MSRFERWSRAKRGLPVDDSSAPEENTYTAESFSSSEVMDDGTVKKGGERLTSR
ncbi:hypothetical protein HLB35_12860 [Halomonas sp. TBZ9]|uniref:DUF3306 domain-containing protein n=1 Tax=Vreelandella azerica TaxID=2732867 RepID=A0A7Y3TZQ5_9GAMM|nr:hypothetical protein [Halomonas azerica]NOG32422.1 hypothetical protein [Halomonas azerica]